MMIKDFVTAKERTTFNPSTLVDYAGYECMGCGRTADEMSRQDGCTDECFEKNSVTTVEGNWYCHIDCFKDSR